MIKNSLFGLYLFTLISSAYSQTTNIVRRQECFNNDWRFTLGDSPDYRESKFDDSEWRLLDVPNDCVIRSTVDDKDGNEVARKENKHSIDYYEMDYKATQSVSFDDPNRWSDKNPYLYTMRSEIEYDGNLYGFSPFYFQFI